MKASSADGQSEPKEMPWPRVPKLSGDEFQQSFAVAQLAVKLCELKKAATKVPLEKDNLDPQKCLAQAWELIQSAREHVARPQTNAEYLAAHGGSHEAAENVVGSTLSASRVSFKKLCDPGRNKGGPEIIKLPDVETGKTIEVEWRVYRGKGGERAFDNLFWAQTRPCRFATLTRCWRTPPFDRTRYSWVSRRSIPCRAITASANCVWRYPATEGTHSTSQESLRSNEIAASSSTNAINNSSARTTKRFPSLRYAPTHVRPSGGWAQTTSRARRVLSLLRLLS